MSQKRKEEKNGRGCAIFLWRGWVIFKKFQFVFFFFFFSFRGDIAWFLLLRGCMLFFSFLFCCLFCFVVCWLIIFSCREFAWFFWKKILPKFLNKEKEKNVSLHGNKRRTQFDQDQDQDLRKCLFCAWVRGRWQVGGGRVHPNYFDTNGHTIFWFWSSQPNIRNTFFDQRSPRPPEVGVLRFSQTKKDRQTDIATLWLNSVKT